MSKKVKVLNTDRGGEYQGKEFVSYLKSKGMVQKLNIHDTLQHAGVAEHCNRTIAKHIRALLHSSSDRTGICIGTDIAVSACYFCILEILCTLYMTYS